MKLHITETALKSIDTGAAAKLTVFYQEQKGFAVVITSKGTMTYSIVYRDAHGKQRQEKLASVESLSCNAARALAKTRLQEIAEIRGDKSVLRRSSCPSFDQYFFDSFLPQIKNESRSYETHASLYRNHIQEAFGHRRLNDVDGQDVIAFHTHLRNKPIANGRWAARAGETLSEGTVKRVLILLRHICNAAIRDKRINLKENPTHALKLTTVRKVKGRFLTSQQLQRLLRAANESHNGSLSDIIRVMASTGLRRDNVLGMRWSWFDATRGTLTVPESEDKAKKGFVIHLAGSVQDLLSTLHLNAEGPWVFPNPKTAKPFVSCRAAWVTACQSAGLPGLRMHDLRHTFASMMLDNGADIVDVQQALAHTQLKTTAVYLHLTEARKRMHANATVNATGLFA
ncbi:tyrosine-type recombinase/integrase [Alcaligenaceae bacterium]|nr:tyrosine-type recombinase/integrase [Alcaligenaceae bacterium]